ncbi:MAG: hypothetical protein C4291_03060 [Candidatus Dadabacteria bacterium]
MSQFEPVVMEHKPDLVMVYGDVNSTMAAALVCAKPLISIGHVEAGLRSFDRTMPEGVNRLITDRVADLLIQLSSKHHPTPMYQDKIREMLNNRFPGVTSYFQAADIISQVLNFGLPAPIDVQISGNNLESDYEIAKRLMEKMRKIPGIRDIRIAQSLDYPAFKVDVDHARALELGLHLHMVLTRR